MFLLPWLALVVCSSLALLVYSRRKSGEIPKGDYSSYIGNESKKGLKILAIVNPHGGKRRALRVWNSMIPVLEAAGYTVETVRTERKHHATELARLACYRSVKPDVCVCVGGDGFLFEVLNGLCENQDGTIPKEIATKIPVALVPEGTGNGCASSMGIRGSEDAVRTLTQGTLGNMDLMLVTQQNLRKVCGLSLAWGAIADHDYYGEIKLRALGPPRNLIAPALVITQLRPRQGRVLMQLHSVQDSQWTTRGGRRTLATVPITHDGAEWQSITGAFVLVQIVSMPWLASDTLAVPGCRHDDGTMYVVIMRKGRDTSRLNMINLFFTMSSGNHINLDFVEIYACTRARIEPTDTDGHMAVDGEAVPYATTDIVIYPSTAQAYTLRR